MSKPYSSKNITIIVNGQYIVELRDGNAYNYSEDEDRYSRYTGVDGSTTHSERPGNACMITVGTRDNSISNKYLNDLYESRASIDMTVIDNNENGKTITGNNGVIMRRPDEGKGKEIGEMEWVFDFKDHKVNYH